VVISNNEDKIHSLEAEVRRLQDMLAAGDQDGSELRKLLAETQKQLFEAGERINKLITDVNSGKELA